MAEELDCEELWRVRQIALASVRHEAVAPDEILWLTNTCERLSDEIAEDADKTVTAEELSEAELRAEHAEERLEEVLQKISKSDKELVKKTSGLEEKLAELRAENEKLKAFRPERLMFLRKAMHACVRELDGVTGSDPVKPARKRRSS